MTSGYILALDQGTSNTKALLVNTAGEIVFRSAVAMQVFTRRGGHVEQDANALWNASSQVVRDCLARVGDRAVAAIGITNQRETVLVWDRKSGQPVTPAVLWQCRRSEERCAELVSQGRESTIESRTGLRVDPLFSASKVEWLLDRSEDLRARAKAGELCLGTVDSWLIFKLTGGKVHATDASNASRTQLFNLAEGRWDDEMLRLFRIPAVMLPRVVDSCGVIAQTAAVDGVPEGIPIASAIGDSHAALVGHGIFSPGPVKATYGTGSSLMTLRPDCKRVSQSLTRTVAWSNTGKLQYALEGNITMAGAALQWLCDFLGSETTVQKVLDLADTVEDSGGVYLVPAMSGLGAPYWDSAAQGAIYGLSRTSTIAHLARASLEGIAHQVADVFEEMERSQSAMAPVLYADGGASRNGKLMQLQADLLGRTVLRSRSAELSALGAAWLAGLGIGVWNSYAELAEMVPERDAFEPMLDAEKRTALRGGWRLAVKRTRMQAVQ